MLYITFVLRICRTTYGKMNEWMKMPGGRDMRSGIPVTRSDANWKQAAKVRNYTCYSILTHYLSRKFLP